MVGGVACLILLCFIFLSHVWWVGVSDGAFGGSGKEWLPVASFV